MISGIVKSYDLEYTGIDQFCINMKVVLTETNQMIKLEVRGTLNQICTRLNAIPFHRKPLMKHLDNARCLLYFEEDAYRFYAVT